MKSAKQAMENMEYVRRLLEQKQPRFAACLEFAASLVETGHGATSLPAPPDPATTGQEAMDREERSVHDWRVSQLTRLGIPGPPTEVYADRIDWHQIARLVQPGCPPPLSLRIAAEGGRVDPEVTMPEFASELLRTLVRQKPEQVWEALTATGIPLGYLYGMTVESDWRPGTSVTMTLGDQARLTGDVLVAERPRRLSYTLGDHPGQPSVYVNWELRALGDATIVRLYVDEPWPDADPIHDLEAAWLPVLYDLVAYLDWGAGRFPPDRDLPDPSELRFAGLPMPGRTAPATSPRRARACAAVRARSSSEATANLYAAMPQPARRLGPRGASPMSTDTITARPAAGAGAARAKRTTFVLAGGITPDLLADTSAGALNATHWLNWRRCYQARTRWYHRRAQLARDGGITLVS